MGRQQGQSGRQVRPVRALNPYRDDRIRSASGPQASCPGESIVPGARLQREIERKRSHASHLRRRNDTAVSEATRRVQSAFQSTRPRGARLSPAPMRRSRMWPFQSTRPRGARQGQQQRRAEGRNRFNPRAREGRDAFALPLFALALGFQSTRPRGARRPNVIRFDTAAAQFQSTRPRGARRRHHKALIRLGCRPEKCEHERGGGQRGLPTRAEASGVMGFKALRMREPGRVWPDAWGSRVNRRGDRRNPRRAWRPRVRSCRATARPGNRSAGCRARGR